MNTKDSIFPCKCGQILFSFRSYSSHLPYCQANNNANRTVTGAQNPLQYRRSEGRPSKETDKQGHEGLEGQEGLEISRNTGYLNLFEMNMERYKSDEVDSQEAEEMEPTDDMFPDPDSLSVPQEDTTSDSNDDNWQCNIMNPSTVPLPDVIEKEMFKPPPNFNEKYLHTQVLKEETVRFRGNMADRMSAEEKTNLKLLRLLKGTKLGLYNKVHEWRRESVSDYGDRTSARKQPLSRKAAVENIMKLYGYEHMKPRSINLKLPHTGVRYSLVVFSFAAMLLSLLTDPEAMQARNLSFDPENPFRKPKVGGQDGHFDDFNTGQVHCDAHERYCKEENQMLAEITLFIDKTHLDGKGKHTVEPVMFTTGLFNREFRNTQFAWRPLGYLPNLDLLAPHASADKKQQDYHFCLRIIMSEIACYQRLPKGIFWTFAFDELEIHGYLRIPVNCILGDTDGHDKLCARKTNRSGRSKGESPCLCRYCDIPFRLLGRPLEASKIRLTLCGTIRKLRNNTSLPNIQKLSTLGYKRFHDGLVDIQFSDPRRGLHGCTPAEILHAMQLGVEERAIEACFGAKKIKKGNNRTRKRKRALIEEDEDIDEEEDDQDDNQDGTDDDDDDDNDDEDDDEEDDNQDDEDEDDDEDDEDENEEEEEDKVEVMEPLTESDTSRNNVFNKEAMHRVDALAKQLHRFLKWQSDKGLPRTSFPRGITSLTKMQGNERSGVILILLIILIMDYWAASRGPPKKKALKSDDNGYLLEALGFDRHANIVKTLYLILAFEFHMKSTVINQKTLPKIQAFVPCFMDQVLRVFDRKEGVGNNTIKNHLPLHYVEDIRRFGSPQNFNSGTGECLHKTAVKEPGRRTNMNSGTTEFLTGVRYVENITILRGCRDLGYMLDDYTTTQTPGRSNQNSMEVKVPLCRITSNEIFRKNKTKALSRYPTWDESYCKIKDVVSLVRETILPLLPRTNEIQLYATLKKDGQTYKANPCYGSSKISRQDWAYVHMGHDGIVPCQLLCVLDIPEKPTRTIFLNGSAVDEAGKYFIVHSSLVPLTESGPAPYPGKNQNEGTLAHIDQKIVHRIPKSSFRDGTWVSADSSCPPSFLFVDAKSIEGPCIAVPDVLSPNSANEFFILRPVNEWSSLFEESASEWGETKII